LSDSSKKAFEMFGFPASRIYVIPNFIPKVTYTKRTNKTGNTSILYAGRLDETKGLDLLIKALPKVKEKINFLKCYIVGAGPERQNLKKLAERLDVLDNVCFTGFINYKYLGEYYLKSDIFVFPVRWLEPFGRVLLEAMTYRLPIITSETIDHEIAKGAALTFKTNDYNDLADKIIYLLSNEDVQERLSKTGLEQVKNFYPEKVVPKLEEVYMEIIQK
jgi:glycosyltransferase involved in cell wall biosynthesis